MSTMREERRADRTAERSADREDRRLELEARLKAEEIKAEQRRRDAEARDERERKATEAQAEQARKDAVEKRRLELAERKARQAENERRKAARAAKIRRVVRWVKGNTVTVFVGFVMICSIVPAVISQIGALGGAGVPGMLAGLLAAMLEGTAWALTFMGKAAEDAGRPTGRYRISTWATAVLAAGVNYWHWAEALPGRSWVAVVFAASSLIAIYLWDMKTHGSEGKTREQRREEKARRDHLKKRRKDHKDIAKEADRLTSALPYGAISPEDAFAAAWRIRKGAEPGMCAETYATATNAVVQLGAAFELGEHVRPELLRTGLAARALNPLRMGASNLIPTLGPTVPIGALPKAPESRTTQFPLGEYGTATPPTGDAPKARETGPKRRSEEELEKLVPDALIHAADLVAEGKQISAASLAKRMKIRREDGMWLRDRVIEERKLHLVHDGDVA